MAASRESDFHGRQRPVGDFGGVVAQELGKWLHRHPPGCRGLFNFISSDFTSSRTLAGLTR